MYKYETHLHTKHGSACATISGKGQALEYKHAGYTGIIVTEHFFRGNTCIPKDLPWEERINLFCRGYEEAKYYGDKIGLQVFFGWEETYDGQDFLVYGLDKEWLLNHPEVEHWTIKELFLEVSKYGGMVIHAHPFRDSPYIPYMYAKQYNLPITAGGDSHHHDITCSGIGVEERFESIVDYIKCIKENKPKQLLYIN